MFTEFRLSPRRTLLLGAAASAFAAIPAFAEDDEAALEDQLLRVLDSRGLPLSRVDAARVESLVSRLETLGGSQRDQAEGIGAYGPWIGCWNSVYYNAGSGTFPYELRGPSGSTLRMVRTRQFIFGPADANEELRGIGRDGSASLEATYEGDNGSQLLLLARTGAFTKLPSTVFRLDYSQRPTSAYTLSTRNGGTVATPLPSAGGSSYSALGGGGGGDATRRRISYLSERVWISRAVDGGTLTVLQRCDDGGEGKALAPPPTRANLGATCADTADRPVCRREALF